MLHGLTLTSEVNQTAYRGIKIAIKMLVRK